MCDICNLKCKGCNRDIETHIGDFSVPREGVTIFCHECQQAALKYLLDFDKEVIVFTCEQVMFIVELPRAIYLNGTRDECVGKKPPIEGNNTEKE